MELLRFEALSLVEPPLKESDQTDGIDLDKQVVSLLPACLLGLQGFLLWAKTGAGTWGSTLLRL